MTEPKTAENGDGYGKVVTMLGSSGRWRVVEADQNWVLQRKARSVWLAVAHCAEKEKLLRILRANSLGVNDAIRALPHHFRPMAAKEA